MGRIRNHELEGVLEIVPAFQVAAPRTHPGDLLQKNVGGLLHFRKRLLQRDPREGFQDCRYRFLVRLAEPRVVEGVVQNPPRADASFANQGFDELEEEGCFPDLAGPVDSEDFRVAQSLLEGEEIAPWK